MNRRYLTLLAALVAALAIALPACGGGDDGGGEEEEVATVVETAATLTDPADCEVYTTVAFMEQTEQVEGEEAVAACEADVEDTSNDPDSVDVSNVAIDGEDATADIAFTGGGLDGQTLEVSLVKEDGNWKVNRIEGFAEFDRDALVGVFEENFDPAELTPEQYSCVTDALQGADDAQLEALVTAGSEEPLVELFGEC